MSEEKDTQLSYNPKHLEKLKEGVDKWNAWYIPQREKDISFRAQLSNVKIEGLDLSKIHLVAANLVNSQLNGVNFKEAELNGADFQNVDLKATNFAKTKLKHSNFEEANLKGVNFEEADLYCANLDNTNLQDTNLNNANFEGATLFKAELKGISFENAIFKNAGLNHANFEKADIRDSNFEGAFLQCVNFKEACLFQVNLQGAHLHDAQLKSGLLIGSNLEGASCSGANLENTCLDSANLKSADFSGANLKGAELTFAKLDGAYLKNTNLEGADLHFVKLKGANLENANLKSADLRYIHFKNTYLQDADFTEANLSYTKDICFSDNKIEGTIITSTTKSPWITLKKSYTNTMLLFTLVAVFTFFLPYLINIAVWRSVNLSQKLTSDIHTIVLNSVESIDGDNKTQTKVLESLNRNLQSSAPCFSGNCKRWQIWQLVLGIHRKNNGLFFGILSGVLIFYNLCRLYLTQQVSILRDSEQATGLTPRWQTEFFTFTYKNRNIRTSFPISGYKHLFYIHKFVRIVFWIAAISFTIHSVAWLLDPVYLPQS